jgi:muconolactone delta-isomerase
VTEQVMKKLLMETVPKLENIPQNYITISKKIRYRRGDNAPMVHVTIKGSEKEEIVRMQAKEEKERSKEVDSKGFCRRIWSEEKSHYEELVKSKPQQAEFFKRKLARTEYDLWALDKARHEKRVNLLF